MTSQRPVVGLFGKAPFAGDFLRRRLNGAAIQALDVWLQACLAATPEAGRGLEGRSCRFLTAPGLFGATALLGLMGPSRDRVGRDFPLVMAAELGEASGPTPIDLAWCDMAATAVERAARGESPAEELDAAIADLACAYAPGDEAPRLDLTPLASFWWTGEDLARAHQTFARPSLEDFAVICALWKGASGAAGAPHPSGDLDP